MLKEFRPTIFFLLKFALIFGIGSWMYSSYIKAAHQAEVPHPDPFTDLVAIQSNFVVRSLGYDSQVYYPESSSIIYIYITGLDDYGVAFFEGCNGLNIMILFLAFVIAFSNNWRNMLWFIPAGLLAIHIFNLLRIAALTILATVDGSYFHFFHKFVFTGIIYAFVLLLWYVWAVKYSKSAQK